MPDPLCSHLGILLVGHGTRDPQGQQEFRHLASMLASQVVPVPLELSFLELTEPTIDQAVGRLWEIGVRQVVAVPLLLFAAGHVRRDIPGAVEESIARFPGMSVEFVPHLGNSEPVRELSMLRCRETIASPDALPGDGLSPQSLLILVGRGSTDPRATREMEEFVELRRRESAARVVGCFYAMAKPRLSQALSEAAQTDSATIVIQPHLLFSGDLHDAIAQAVEPYRRQCPQRGWLVAPPLGPHPLLAEAAVRRLRPRIDLVAGCNAR